MLTENLSVSASTPYRRLVLDTGFGFPSWYQWVKTSYGKGWLGLHHGEPLSGRDVFRGDSRCDAASTHAADFGKARLACAERHEEIGFAISREKLAKKWKCDWKFALIEAENPDWRD